MRAYFFRFFIMTKLVISTKLMNATIRIISSKGEAPVLRVKDKGRNLKKDIDLVKEFVGNSLSDKVLNDPQLNKLPGWDLAVTVDYPDPTELDGVIEICNITLNHHLGHHTVQLIKLDDNRIVCSYNTVTKFHAHLYYWIDKRTLNIDAHDVNGVKWTSGNITAKDLTELLKLPDSLAPHAVNNILSKVEPSYYLVEFENGATNEYYLSDGVYHLTVTDIDGKLLGKLHGDYLVEHLEDYSMLKTLCGEIPDGTTNN